MHRPKAGEIYIEWLAVSASARGRGVGTKLLDWMEATARERGMTTLSLAVIRGNRAKGLYERKGYVVKELGCCEECWGCCLLTTFFGRPYGFCHPEWGGDDMVKQL